MTSYEEDMFKWAHQSKIYSFKQYNEQSGLEQKMTDACNKSYLVESKQLKASLLL